MSDEPIIVEQLVEIVMTAPTVARPLNKYAALYQYRSSSDGATAWWVIANCASVKEAVAEAMLDKALIYGTIRVFEIPEK